MPAACAMTRDDPTPATSSDLNTLRAALAARPGDVQTWARLGMLLGERDGAAADRAFRHAVALAPDDARGPFNRGVVLHRAGRLEEAVAAYRRALTLSPALVPATTNVCRALAALGRGGEALAAARRHLTWEPAATAILANLGALHAERGRSDAAERLFRAALAADPAYGDVRHNLALLLLDRDRTGEAFELYRDAIHRGIGQPDMYVNIGVMEQSAGRSALAALLYRAALERDPQHVSARINLAAALLEEGEPREAIAQCRAALAQQPDAAETLWNLSCAHLMLGEEEAGFRHYDVRWTQPQPGLRRHTAAAPLWDGRRPAGGRLLLWGEHGIGDEIVYASLLGAALRRAGPTVVECDPRLRALFARSFPDAEVVGRSDPPALATGAPDIVRQSSTLRLPALLRAPADRPGTEGYLRADPQRIADARAQLARVGTGPRIGLSWTSRNSQTAGRKATRLEQWLPVFAAASTASFVSLQYGEVDAEIEAARAAGAGNLHRNPNPDLLQDIDGLAAQIATLDLVISIAGVTAHLAGALGRPCWTLLPPGPLWFWGAAGDSVPWYPSMRLFRRGRAADWSACLAAVAAAIAAQVAAWGAP